MGGGSDMGDLIEERHVLGMTPELVVPNKGAKRRTAKHAKLFFIDLLKERALVEFAGALQIFEEIIF